MPRLWPTCYTPQTMNIHAARAAVPMASYPAIKRPEPRTIGAGCRDRAGWADTVNRTRVRAARVVNSDVYRLPAPASQWCTKPVDVK